MIITITSKGEYLKIALTRKRGLWWIVDRLDGVVWLLCTVERVFKCAGEVPGNNSSPSAAFEQSGNSIVLEMYRSRFESAN